MGRYLDTRGQPTLGIGLCDRCRRKMPLAMLLPDPNSPGLRVCRKDLDVFDPWRLPPRPPDNMVLPFVRPDVSVASHPYGLISEDGDYFFISEDGAYYLVPA